MGLREGFKPSSFTDYCLALFTGLLVLVAIWQFVVTKNQLGVMRNDERGWLEFTFAPTPGAPKTITISYSAGQPISAPVSVINVGKTPVRDVDIKAFSGIFDAKSSVPLNFIDDPGHHSHNDVTEAVIFPTRSMDFSIIRVDRGKVDPATQAEVSAIQSGYSYFAVFGRITYTDVFKVSHKTDFCAWQTNPAAPMRDYQTASCVNFNGVDDK